MNIYTSSWRPHILQILILGTLTCIQITILLEKTLFYASQTSAMPSLPKVTHPNARFIRQV